jgi:hypothetical protein
MPTPIRPEPGETCRNCGTTLLGPWCHECGQSLRTPIRELGALIIDGIQQVLNINKLFRSLLPLCRHAVPVHDHPRPAGRPARQRAGLRALKAPRIRWQTAADCRSIPATRHG